MLVQKQFQHQVITAHLAQTMSLLELTGLELRQKIETELATNPALELVELRHCPNCHRALLDNAPCPVCSRIYFGTSEQPIVFISPRTDFYSTGRYRTNDDENISEEWTANTEELPVYVLHQIAPELDPSDRPIAAHILTSLDDDGLLRIPLTEISRYHHVPLERVIKVLQLIQLADPVGVGSTSPQEALLIQLDVLSDTYHVHPLARRAIQEGMEMLSRHAYYELGRLLGVSPIEAQKVSNFIIENLNPYPARAHWGDIRSGPESNNVYHTPDVIVSKLYDTDDTPLVVEVISPYSGSLRINPLFREALEQAPLEKSENWQMDLDHAVLLIKCIQQRNHTLVRLMQRIVVLQREYILNGDAYLLPITRASLADELLVHESTVSRAVSDKAVQLPNNRIIPLSKLFDRSLHIRTALKEIIAQEMKPLSDTQIARLLSIQGFEVARRTVAKYRSMEGILPARLRQPTTNLSAL